MRTGICGTGLIVASLVSCSGMDAGEPSWGEEVTDSPGEVLAPAEPGSRPPGTSKTLAPELANQVPEEEITDSDGHVYRLVGEARFSFAPPPGPGDGGEALEREWTIETLAEALRPIKLVGRFEYTTDPPVELARRILEQHPSDEDLALYDTSEQEPRAGRNCCGNDGREYKGNNTTAPWSYMIFSEVGCSGTMISPTTMVTAAHCVYDTDADAWINRWNGSVWRLPYYAPGMDAQDATPAPYGWQSCYSVSVPSDYTTGDSPAEFDYAVIDFSSAAYGCTGNAPGANSGFMGTGMPTKTTIEGSPTYMYGYPGGTNPGASINGTLTSRYVGSWWLYTEGEIWGIGKSAGGTYITSPTWQLKYTIDTSAGTSGSANWYESSGRKLIGIHKGVASDDSYNLGRRWDWTVRNFVEANSPFPD